MPVGGGKFSLEKTWHSAAPSTTTLNASGNFTIPYGKYDIKIYGYGGSDLPGNYVSTNPGYTYYYTNPPAPGPGFNFNQTVSSYQATNLYGGNPISPPVYYSGTSSGSGASCPSSYSYYASGFPPGNGYTTYVNYSCSPGYIVIPGNYVGVYVPGNANYNPTTPASPSSVMGVTVPALTNIAAPAAVTVNYRTYPDNATYPATVSYAGQLVIQYR